MSISADRLRQLFSYDPETGDFSRLVTVGNRPPGSTVGTLIKKPGYTAYLQISVDGKVFKAHRLAWLYMTGDLPAMMVDHKDGDGLNNRWFNLREANPTQNQQNRKPRKNSASGLKGVSKDGDSWIAAIRLNKRTKFLGRFSTPENAHAAYVEFARIVHGQFARFS